MGQACGTSKGDKGSAASQKNRAMAEDQSGNSDVEMECVVQEPIVEVSLVGTIAPDFKARAVMPDGTIREVSLEDEYKGKSVLLLFYPLDFSYNCPSELLVFSEAHDEFKKRTVEVLACSIDSHFCHTAWRDYAGEVKFPMVADTTTEISRAYGVMHPHGHSHRALFFMDDEHKIFHSLVNSPAIGRSVEEALRVADAVNLHKREGVVCPANWKKGKRPMTPTAEGVAQYLAETESGK